MSNAQSPFLNTPIERISFFNFQFSIPPPINYQLSIINCLLAFKMPKDASRSVLEPLTYP